MITNNYKNFLRALFTGRYSSDYSIVSYNGEVKTISTTVSNGNLYHAEEAPAASLLKLYTSGNNNGICIGRGSTPASSSDYTLEDMISTASYSLILPNNYRRIVTADEKALYTITYSIRNISETDLIIGEIGLFSKIGASSATVSSTISTAILVDRTVLEEPLIIPPGEIRALTYNLKFDLNFE